MHKLLSIPALSFVLACDGSAPTSTDAGGAGGAPTEDTVSSGGGPTHDQTGGSGGVGGAPAIERRPTYLALGDSIAFGYNINHREYLPNGTAHDLPDQAAHAIGYPEALVKMLEGDAVIPLEVANTACPGEAAGSLVSGKHVDDNDCFENRHVYDLHYEYEHADYDYQDGTEQNAGNYGSGVSQLDHALAYLAEDPDHVKLITITMGANDVTKFVLAECNWLQSLWDTGCLVGGTVDAILNKIQQSWETTLTALAQSDYDGPIVVVLYYSTGYRLTDLPMRAGIKLLNAKIHDGAKVVLEQYPTLNLKFVESYDVFQSLSSGFGDDPCEAGLTMLIADGPDAGTCDVHASVFGEEQLAAEVWKSLTFTEQQALLGR